MPVLKETMTDDCSETEEHELPVIEALLAGTLVLMTGYSQTLQAELHPRQRLLMGEKIRSNLSLLIEIPHSSPGFREVLRGLQVRWQAMTACTREAALDCAATADPYRRRTPDALLEAQHGAGKRLH